MSVSTPAPGRVENGTAPAPKRRHPRAALAAAMLGFFVVALVAQASFLHGLHVSYLTATVLLAMTAAASATLPRVTR